MHIRCISEAQLKKDQDHFVVIEESGDSATEILALMKKNRFFNLILDGKTCDTAILDFPEFREVFEMSILSIFQLQY